MALLSDVSGKKQKQSSQKITEGIGEYFQNRLELSAYFIVGLPKDPEREPKIEFALDGTPQELGTLISALLAMTPDSVKRAIMKEEYKRQHKHAGHVIDQL